MVPSPLEEVGAPSSSAGIGNNSAEVNSPLFALNTCTSDALAELLRHLKRSYWPLPWDTSPSSVPTGSSKDDLMSHGGFRPAAKVRSKYVGRIAPLLAPITFRLDIRLFNAVGCMW